MKSIILTLFIWLGAIPLIWLFKTRKLFVRNIGAWSVVSGSAIGLFKSMEILICGIKDEIFLPWFIPWGSFHIAIDPLTDWFLIPIFAIGALSALYGIFYDERVESHFSPAFSWTMFSVLLASLVLVVCARDAVLFFIAWETMAIASFFLVIREHHEHEVQKAGLLYLVSTHIGTIFILILFLINASRTGSFDFNEWKEIAPAPKYASLLFVLALVGFGTKAGFAPLHIWLPEAHPAAPSYVSALMSGVMIKTGLYGLLRSLEWSGEVKPWWGFLTIGIGVCSGLIGILFALAQRDVKRMLAFSSVENVGIICLGIGAGIVGVAYNEPMVAFCGFAGGLLHIMNHAFFKTALFFAAGEIYCSIKERNMEKMGGLIKTALKRAGIVFLVASLAVTAIPPLNGFVGEFIILFSGFSGVMSSKPHLFLFSAILVCGLALIGGLSLACFARAFGVVFLGEARTEKASQPEKGGVFISLPMLISILICIFLGISGAWIVSYVKPVVSVVFPHGLDEFDKPLHTLQTPLFYASLAGVLVFSLSILLYVLRAAFLRRKKPEIEVTWDCGYAQPTNRMQYTASSFSQPFIHLFKPILRTRIKTQMTKNYFPTRGSFHSETPDIFHLDFYAPLFRKIHEHLSRIKLLQHGYIQIYILYIALTLLILIIWKLG